MIVYSKNIARFVEEILRTLRTLLQTEARLRVTQNRFYNATGRSSYPLSVVIYNHKRQLGYFSPAFYELGFHECLMQTSRTKLHEVIRHELAHYLTFIEYGDVPAHGPHFRATCQKLGWGEEVARATTCLDDGVSIVAPPVKVLRRVQKLMALSASSNPHEAELAMMKSQQLLLKHHIDTPPSEEEKLYLVRLLQQKKQEGKFHAIARILESFFVHIVYRKSGEGVCLEALGSLVNVQIAEHVAAVLSSELDLLWEKIRKTRCLKGLTAKNSFFIGIAKGYCEKVQALKREYSQEASRALLVLEHQLAEAVALAYPRLSHTQRRSSYCPHSSALGEQAGRALSINSAISRKDSEQLLLH